VAEKVTKMDFYLGSIVLQGAEIGVLPLRLGLIVRCCRYTRCE